MGKVFADYLRSLRDKDLIYHKSNEGYIAVMEGGLLTPLILK
jgi:hypothetical protein